MSCPKGCREYHTHKTFSCEKCHPINREWEALWNKEFGNLTLGIVTGEKRSPVFVNNDLEVPRLKNFISRILLSERQAILDELYTKVDGMRKPDPTCMEFHISDADINTVCGTCGLTRANMPYVKIDSYNRALDAVLALIKPSK